MGCRRRFTSYERIEDVPLWIVKKNGQREAFDRGKILRGIMTSCEKRPIALEQVERMVDDVERVLKDGHPREISTRAIGELVMERLQKLDEVAYGRFASVYRQFTDIEGFRQELERLLHPSRDGLA